MRAFWFKFGIIINIHLKHLMAVIVEMKEAKNAAEVVIEVTHMVSNEWLRAAWTIASNCSSIEFRFGSAFEWAFQAFTRIKVSSAPTPEKIQQIYLRPVHLQLSWFIYTLGAEMFGVGDFCLETRVIIKISTHPWYPRNFDWFSWDFFFFKMAWLMGRALMCLNLYGWETVWHKLKNRQKMHFLCF